MAAIPGPPSFCDLIDYGEIVIHLSRAEIQSGSTFAIHRLVSLNLRRSQFSTLRRWGSVEKLTFPRPKLQCDWAINRLSGMSGSPIIDGNCEALGVVCAGGGTKIHTEGGRCPRLVYNLPGWLLQELRL